MNFKKIIAPLLVLCIPFVSGCSATQEQPVTTVADVSEVTTVSADDMFTDRDKDTSYDEATAVNIVLADGKSTVSDSSVTIQDNTVTITAEGDYVVSGKLTDGQLVVNCKDTDKPHIIFNGAEITCKTSAPVYIKEADKVVITLKESTQNTLSVSGQFENIDENNIDGAVFSKADLSFNGKGTLKVTSANGHGIVCKDDLVFAGGNYTVDAASHTVDANDSVRAADSTFLLTSGKDGIHVENNDDATSGFLFMQNCTLTSTADGDGIDTSAYANINGGTLKITSGGGVANAEQKRDEFAPFMNGSQTETSDTPSAKGIKAGGDLSIVNSTVTCDSADDAIHSNASLTVNATLSLKTGDDGLHADVNTVINGGTLTVSQSYEGIEGQTVTVKGGTVSVKSSDDGINAAGGVDGSGTDGGMGKDVFAVDENCFVKISGGKITLDADGDGIDSNGSLEVTGGETYVWGPTNSANGALDYASSAQITGGTFVATGAQGMAANFSSASNQGAALVNINGTSSLKVKNSEGKEILSCSPSKTFQCAVISCPSITQGNTYTVTSDSSSAEVEMTSSVVGGSNGFGGGMQGGKPGGPGGRQDFSNIDPGNIPSMPDNFNGEMPSLPDGFNGEIPSMPEGMTPPQGNMFGGNREQV